VKPLWIKLVVYTIIFALVVTTVLTGVGLFF